MDWLANGSVPEIICVYLRPSAVTLNFFNRLLRFERHHVRLRGVDERGAGLRDGGDAESLEIVTSAHCFAADDGRGVSRRIKNCLQF